MGIDAAGAEFLGFAAANGVDFGSTLTLGQQSRFGPPEELAAAADRWSLPSSSASALAAELGGDPSHVDPLLRALGAASIDSLDISGFEGATILHDLNTPLPAGLEGRWTCVIDGGVTEHVFQFPMALESSMKLVAPGGHLISIVPANQQMGHGFYQVGPEVYFRALIPENGYALRGVFLHEQASRGRWFKLRDPDAAGHRIELRTAGPAMLYVVARRTGIAGLHHQPQQSDYATAWDAAEAPKTATTTRASATRQAIYRRIGPGAGRALQHARRLQAMWTRSGLQPIDLRSAILPGAAKAKPEGPTSAS